MVAGRIAGKADSLFTSANVLPEQIAANAFTITGSNDFITLVPGNLSAADPFLDFSSNSGNVLLGMIAATAPATVPETPTSGLLLAGMLALVAVVLWKRRMAEQA